jgi:polyferredoxin
MTGMVTWKFDLVMECLPLMLQFALLLLGYALSDYLYFINKVIASAIIGFTGFGLLFYLLIISAATLSYNCPFQTPASLVLRFLIRFDDQHKRYLKRSGKWLGRIFRRKEQQRPNPGGLPLGSAPSTGA